MPVGFFLVEMRKVQHLLFCEVRPNQLQTGGQASNAAAWNRDARHTGEVYRYRIDVIQIHLHRVIYFLADLKCRSRRSRASQNIDLLETTLQIIINQLPDFLGLQVIGIVVTGRQHVGACHDAPLNLITETFHTRTFVKAFKIITISSAMAETHTIKAG